MPKSRKRPGAKKYQPRMGPFRADPQAMMQAVARGVGSEEDLDAICEYLLISMQNTSPAAGQPWLELGMTSWPPTTRDDIRTMARLAFPKENDESSRQEARTEPAGSQAE